MIAMFACSFVFNCFTSLCVSTIFASRLMFWTNWNELAPSIMRSSLAGANVLVIVGNSIRTPNGLAIDHRAEKLYFSDATLDKIERCEYDGTNRFVSARSCVCVCGSFSFSTFITMCVCRWS